MTNLSAYLRRISIDSMIINLGLPERREMAPLRAKTFVNRV